MSFTLPFNFEPANTGAIASGTYTVPAGKYAQVTVHVRNGGSATFNGTSLVTSQATSQTTQNITTVQADFSSSSSGTLYTGASNSMFEGHVYITSGTSINVLVGGGSIVSGYNAGGITFIPVICGNDNITFTGSTASISLCGVRREELLEGNAEIETTQSITIWASAGDAIALSGTGDIHFAEFNNLS